MEDKHMFNVPKNIKKENEKITISVEEVIPQGDLIQKKIVKTNVNPCKFYSLINSFLI
jgi:hypothetical protein